MLSSSLYKGFLIILFIFLFLQNPSNFRDLLVIIYNIHIHRYTGTQTSAISGIFVGHLQYLTASTSAIPTMSSLLLSLSAPSMVLHKSGSKTQLPPSFHLPCLISHHPSNFDYHQRLGHHEVLTTTGSNKGSRFTKSCGFGF